MSHLSCKVTPQLAVLDWFQGSSFTHAENTADFDFGGSSPVVLPPIDGRQLVAFVPKDGDVFVLDSQTLAIYTTPLTRVIRQCICYRRHAQIDRCRVHVVVERHRRQLHRRTVL